LLRDGDEEEEEGKMKNANANTNEVEEREDRVRAASGLETRRDVLTNEDVFFAFYLFMSIYLRYSNEDVQFTTGARESFEKNLRKNLVCTTGRTFTGR
jgi:hypothetical protein